MSARLPLVALTIVIAMATTGSAADPVFSGPQVGEKLVPFKVKGVLGDLKEKELDFVTDADGKPIVILFVHKLTRPSAAMTRALMNYVASRKKDGLHGGVAWLANDLTEAEATINRAKHALPKSTPIGLSKDGIEGPGAYGLNRDVTLTILVGEKNKVTANFALVQPSTQADLPKIVKSVVELVGGKVPTLAQLGVQMRRPGAMRTKLKPEAEGKLRSLIQKSNSEEQTTKIAGELEDLFKKERSTATAIASIANRIINAGVLKRYGTPKAQEYLKKWAKEYGTKPIDPKARDKKNDSVKKSEKRGTNKDSKDDAK